jgi:GNAT superfamily N-acetyltransferase
MIAGDSRLARMWASLIERTWLEHGGCYELKPHAGAAVWLPLDSWLISPAAQAQLVAPLLGATRDALPRVLRVHFFNDHKHPRQPAHWYLATTGVMPAWQARGYGQASVRPAVERCDRDRLPAYLEATTPRNRAFYERNGFEVVEECTYAAGAVTTWRMWREPMQSTVRPLHERTLTARRNAYRDPRRSSERRRRGA